MRILASYNIKGGVGKTVTSVNLAYLAAAEGSRTLLWDLDPQGAASFYFRIKPKVKGGGKKLIRGRRPLDRAIRGTDFELLDLLPADFSYRNLDLFLERTRKPGRRLGRLLQPLANDYDYVFLDCAPGISLVSESVFVAADALLVPTIPTTLSLRTLDRLEKYLAGMDRRRPAVLPFFCMVDARRALHREYCDGAGGRRDFLNTRIPVSSTVERMGVRRAPIATFARASRPARAYEHLWTEIKSKL